MAENEKDVPIKEQKDGSVLAKVDLPEEIESEEESTKKVETSQDRNDDDEESDDHDDEENDGDTDEEREKIREARREERKLKKELKKQRDLSAQNKIKALQRNNEELARRLAQVENTAATFQFAQVDKALEDEATRVEYAKMKLLQASQNQDAASQVEYLEQLQEAKTRLAQIQAYKKQQLEEAKRPKQNVPTPVSNDVQRNATKWLKDNKWFDPQARDTDSKIAKVIDQELAAEDWDPADPEYWDELNSRLKARLPHRYAQKGEKQQRRGGPTASSRTANPGVKSAGTITLSKARVDAIKDAGAWDDPAKRAKMIKAYAQFDRQNRIQD